MLFFVILEELTLLLYIAKTINFDAAKVPLIERALKWDILVVLACLLVILYRYNSTMIDYIHYNKR